MPCLTRSSLRRSALAVALLGLPAAGLAQDAAHGTDSTSDRVGSRAIEVWAAYSPGSVNLGVLGTRTGLRYAEAGMRFKHRIATRASYVLEYTVDIIPAALMSPPLQSGSRSLDVELAPPPRCGFGTIGCAFPGGSAHGVGVSPLGLTAVFRRDQMLQWRLGVAGGGLMFDQRVPTSISTAANFSAALEAGAQFVARDGRGVVLMYRFHHISNAGIGFDNSGLASHMLLLGARWRR